ncbi:RidA family protein [Leucobacter sp. USHLN153]|uniref:RidA family protein n=1 Tax=Leucobacter sp. USHLN153 TaxID=3081268 RepID=UPI0030169531
MTTLQPIGGDSPETRQYTYTPAIRLGDLVFVSGQIAIDDAGQLLGEGDFWAQGNQVFRRLSSLLEQSGSALDRVVKVTVYLTRLSDFGTFVELRRKWLRPPYPADTTVVVESLARPGALLEVEAVAAAL